MTNILIIGLIQCFIFLALNIQKRNKNSADYVLLLWLLVFASHLLMIYLEAIDEAPSVFQVLSKAVVLLHGPILFIYAIKVFKNESKRYQSLHLAPFVMLSTAGLVLNEPNHILWQDVLLVVKVSSIVGYSSFTIYWLNRRSVELRNQNSSNIVLEISWVRALALLLLSSYLVSLLFALFNQVLDWGLDNNLDLVVYVIMITVMGYYGLKLGVVFKSDPVPDAQTKKSYRHSPLRVEQIQQIEEQVSIYFASNDTYMNPDFSLQMLSDSLQIPRHHLSQVINDKMNTSFYDLVNFQRIEFAKEKMISGASSHETLESLGYEAGFNTKAAFFIHFKKVTGKTPGQFKKEIGID